MRYLLTILLGLFTIASCSDGNSEKAQLKKLPDNSIFHLTSEWQNQDSQTLYLKNLRGKTLVVVMIYTSCKTACPILVGKMKNIESLIPKKYMEDVNLVLVSIDPEVDTPDRLNEFAVKNEMYGPQWTFLTSNEDNTKEFANVLSMKYKRIDPIDFSHSNIITVFNPLGEMVIQEEGLEINVEKITGIVTETVESFK